MLILQKNLAWQYLHKLNTQSYITRKYASTSVYRRPIKICMKIYDIDLIADFDSSARYIGTLSNYKRYIATLVKGFTYEENKKVISRSGSGLHQLLVRFTTP